MISKVASRIKLLLQLLGLSMLNSEMEWYITSSKIHLNVEQNFKYTCLGLI